MDQKRTEFYNRLSRASRTVVVESPLSAPSKSRRMVRNERIVDMLARQKAFSESLRYTTNPHVKPKVWTPILLFVLAVSMGALAALIACFVKYRVAGVPDISADLNLGMDAIFSIAIAFLMRELVSLSGIRQMGAQVVGIFLALMMMHNVVHRMPDTFAQLFSPDWVSHVTETTEPGTLLFRGVSYHI